MRASLLCLGLLAGGCSAATDADCGAAYDRLLALGVPADEASAPTRAALEGSRSGFVGRCVATLSARDLTCTLAAQDRAAFGACQRP